MPIRKIQVIIFFMLFLPIVGARTYTQDYLNFLTRSTADIIYCMQNGDCTIHNLNITGNATIINATITNTNINGSITAHRYLENGTDLHDIFVDEAGDFVTWLNVTGDLNVSVYTRLAELYVGEYAYFNKDVGIPNGNLGISDNYIYDSGAINSINLEAAAGGIEIFSPGTRIVLWTDRAYTYGSHNIQDNDARAFIVEDSTDYTDIFRVDTINNRIYLNGSVEVTGNITSKKNIYTTGNMSANKGTFKKLIANSSTEITLVDLQRTSSTAFTGAWKNINNDITLNGTGSGGIFVRTYGMYSNILDKRVLMGNPFFDYVEGVSGGISMTNKKTTARNTILNGLRFGVTDTAKYNYTGATTSENNGIDIQISSNLNIDVGAANTLTNTLTVLTGNIGYSPTITSGTLTATAYGIKLEKGTVNLAGTTPTYYAFYNPIDEFTTSWNIYNPSTADNYMGEDNTYTYFGTGQDSAISYNGSDMIIVPNLVGSGDMIIKGNLGVEGNVNVSGCICYDNGATCLGTCI